MCPSSFIPGVSSQLDNHDLSKLRSPVSFFFLSVFSFYCSSAPRYFRSWNLSPHSAAPHCPSTGCAMLGTWLACHSETYVLSQPIWNCLLWLQVARLALFHLLPWVLVPPTHDSEFSLPWCLPWLPWDQLKLSHVLVKYQEFPWIKRGYRLSNSVSVK